MRKALELLMSFCKCLAFLVAAFAICWLGFIAGCRSNAEIEFLEKNPVHQQLVRCAKNEVLHGMDVSYWQGTIDWDAVVSDQIAFAYIRVSDGVDPLDSEFSRNWAEAKRVGIRRGAYQFFRPSEDAIAQAELLAEQVGVLLPEDLPPAVDVEADDGKTAEEIVTALGTWITKTEELTGRIPVIYTGTWFWDSFVCSSEFVDHPLWVAHYNVECPNLPESWAQWAFFQTTSSGSVDGIAGNVDLDLFNGNASDLTMLVQRSAIVCGDGRCNGNEQRDTCPIDCICEPIPALGRIIDEQEICFERLGKTEFWFEEYLGHDDSLLWTHTISSPPAGNIGIWKLNLQEAGLYQVEANIQAPWGQSQQAVYNIKHNGAEDVVVVDQSTSSGWTLIGQFDFAESSDPIDQQVRLEDVTGEHYTNQIQLVFDAIRLVRVTEPEPDGMPDGGGLHEDEWIPSDASSGDSDNTEIPDAFSGDVIQDIDAVAENQAPAVAHGGCAGCAQANDPSDVKPIVLWIALLLMLNKTRERRLPL